jgi:hypothetical protein
MGGLHQGGLWPGEQGEHDECEELLECGTPAAEFPTMCSYLPQTSIFAAACSGLGCGVWRGGQRCMVQLCWRGNHLSLHALRSKLINRCFLVSGSEK